MMMMLMIAEDILNNAQRPVLLWAVVMGRGVLYWPWKDFPDGGRHGGLGKNSTEIEDIDRVGVNVHGGG